VSPPERPSITKSPGDELTVATKITETEMSSEQTRHTARGADGGAWTVSGEGFLP